MKFLILFSLILLSACGDKDTHTTNQYEEYEINGNVTLDASMKYSPNHHYDGTILVKESRNYTIPPQLEVIYGNAGNYLAEVRFGDTVCVYQGGSLLSRPLLTTNRVEIAKGRSYNFVSCNGFRLPTPSLVWVDSGQYITVRIHGDETASTRVRAILGLR